MINVGNNKVSRTYEVLDSPSELIQLRTTSKNILCECPFCPTKYKPSESGTYPHLYMTKDLSVGICFRCNTVVIIKSDADEKSNISYEESIQYLIESVCCSVTSRKSYYTEVEDVFLPKIEFPETRKLSEECLSYLITRSGYILDFIRDIELYGFTLYNKRDGILFPFKYDNGNYFNYQVRFRDKLKPKYWFKPGPKLFYSMVGLPTKHVDTITICEGVFDTFGLRYMNFPSPLAVTGSYLTDTQIHYMKQILTPNKIYVCMDNTAVNESMTEQLYNNIFTASDIIPINFSDEKDPDELAMSIALNK